MAPQLISCFDFFNPIFFFSIQLQLEENMAAAAGAGVHSQLDPAVTIEGFYSEGQKKYDSAMSMCENLNKSVIDPKIVAAVKNQVALYGRMMNVNAFMDVIGKCKTVNTVTLSGFKEISITDEIQVPEHIEFVVFLYSTRKAIDAFHEIICGKKAWGATQELAYHGEEPPYCVTFAPPSKSPVAKAT